MDIRHLCLFWVVLQLSPGFSQTETLSGPWGTIHGDNFGTAATLDIDYRMGTGPVEEAWRLNVRALDYERPGARSPITFDADGNIYWKTSIGYFTGSEPCVVSVDPDGHVRWAGTTPDGNLLRLGNFYDDTAVVVGDNACYVFCGSVQEHGESLYIAAFDRATGVRIWKTELAEAVPALWDGRSIYGVKLLTPVLHEGHLYVLAPHKDEGHTKNVYKISCDDGQVLWHRALEDIQIVMIGQITLVPDAFGDGEHGLYCNDDSGGGADSKSEVFAIKASTDGAEIAWHCEGGKAAHSHMIYSQALDMLFACTWEVYGATLYSYDPVEEPLEAVSNEQNAGHGHYYVRCLDFNNTDVIAGSYAGMVFRYRCEGELTSEIVYDDEDLNETYWGEYRVYGQLLQDPDGNSILLTGTNCNIDLDPTYTARVVAIDVTNGRLLWAYDTKVGLCDNYPLRGGPTMGPDRKVYFFDSFTGELVALKGPDRLPGPMFRRGDPNGDDQNDLADAIFILTYLFAVERELPGCMDAADANDDGNIDLADAIRLLGYLFNNEGPLPAPFDLCGEDETEDDLDCEQYLPCNPHPE